jgi:uncharacterized protein
MKTIFLIHGAYGNPKQNWFPWLRKELKKRGFRVIAPTFPTPKKQNLTNWMKVFKTYDRYINEETILIGHSLGVAFILTILERYKGKKRINGIILVAGFTGTIANPAFDTINKTIAGRIFKWSKIRENCEKIRIYHGDDDPYVPQQKALYLSKKLHAPSVIIHNAGHFNKKSGYITFPRLLKDIQTFNKQ